jgi:hypothetical protein
MDEISIELRLLFNKELDERDRGMDSIIENLVVLT